MVAKVVPAKQWPIERQLRARIKHAFDEAGISIPFPQRTVWLRQEDVAPADGEPRAPVDGNGDELPAGQPRRDADLGDPLEPASEDARGGGAARPSASPWFDTKKGSSTPSV
jgi:hypothetical protein